jgi:hypothetical protein
MKYNNKDKETLRIFWTCRYINCGIAKVLIIFLSFQITMNVVWEHTAQKCCPRVQTRLVALNACALKDIFLMEPYVKVNT